MSYPLAFSEPDQRLLTAMMGKPFHSLDGYNTSTLAKAYRMGFIAPDIPHTPDTPFATANWQLTPVGLAFATAIDALHRRDTANQQHLEAS